MIWGGYHEANFLTDNSRDQKIHYNEKLQDLNNIEEEGLKFRNNHINRLRQLGGSANLWANQIMTIEENEITNSEKYSKQYKITNKNKYAKWKVI